jgi:hypothetical protein
LLPIEPTQAPSTHFNVKPTQADLLTLSSGAHSPLLELQSSSGNGLFNDCPEANDMDASVYVALTAGASSSCASTVGAPHCTQKSCADGSSTRQSRTRTTSSQKPWWQKSALTSAPQRKSKNTKVDTERALAAPTPCGVSLSTTDFDRSDWEIMYPLFVTEGLIDPSERVRRIDA